MQQIVYPIMQNLMGSLLLFTEIDTTFRTKILMKIWLSVIYAHMVDFHSLVQLPIYSED